jgi:hypothetical protein
MSQSSQIFIPTTDYTRLLPRPPPDSIRNLQNAWNRTIPGLTTSERHAYGEATSGSLWKIWDAITSEVQLTSQDVLVDWGCGAGKMLLSKQYFSPFPQMTARGFEIDKAVYAKAIQNLSLLEIENTEVRLADSVSVQSWAPATIVMQYDGGPQSHIMEEHRTIMTTIFGSPTIRVVFSTKLTEGLFRSYFATPRQLNAWRVVRIRGLSFGGSKFIGYLWIRR